MRLSQQTKDIFWGIGKFFIGVSILVIAGLFIWVATFDIPDIQSFNDRRIEQSTKIYDRTGEVLLYDLNRDVRRTTVPLSDISENLQVATLAIEDSGFYNHLGIKPSAILRAAWTNLKAGSFKQGGSTLTQQVVKNTLLTPEKTISRKIKEWILALRLDQKLTKEEILEIYLNEIPYGGRVYGAEEAAKRFFGKSANNLSITESAYLAALPKAPTYYSPYGNNRDKLEQRKNEVLREMRNNGFISQNEYEQARNEEITFADEEVESLRAPHFVFHIRKYLEQEYGTTAIERRGLRVITTLDYELQKQASNIVEDYGRRNAEQFNANNAALVAVEPQTGKIRTMVGSREYGSEEIQGSFNAATAKRQPGSSFKPFAYATALNKGYTDETVVFDLPTQFSNNCPVSQFSSDNNCFSPVNYDGKFRGPISLRDALAQSVNIPSVKTLYLAGMESSLDTARRMGINTLESQPDRYGLSLVLGSGEVTLLDLTSAYGVFANEGVKNPHTGIARIEDSSGETLESFEKEPEQVLPTDTARMMNDILSDNVARTAAFGPNSPLHFENYDVAAKTGTTNNYRDLWTVGYSPKLSVGVWSGNNDNSSIDGEVAGFVVAPMWHDFMETALQEIDNNEQFNEPQPISDDLKSILRGQWNPNETANILGGSSVEVRQSDTTSSGIHNILHWVDKNNPRGPTPVSPSSDPQYDQWEYSVRRWASGNGFNDDVGGEVEDVPESTEGDTSDDIPDEYEDADESFLNLTSSVSSLYTDNEQLTISAENNDQIDRLEVFINGNLAGDDDSQPFRITIELDDIDNLEETNKVLIRGINENEKENTITRTFTLSDD
jgi:1A family penicillin-binding protein